MKERTKEREREREREKERKKERTKRKTGKKEYGPKDGYTTVYLKRLRTFEALRCFKKVFSWDVL